MNNYFNVIKQKGFTMIELVIVIMLMGIISVSMGQFVLSPLTTYQNISRRIALVDTADTALRKIDKDMHNALPNSIRISGDTIEMINVVHAARYRSEVSGAVGSDMLSFSTVDDSFQILGNVDSLPVGTRLSVYNIGALEIGGDPKRGANVYADNSNTTFPPLGSNVITPAATTIALVDNGNEDQITITPAFQFAFSSPQKRVYFVDGPVTYHCNESTGIITRYAGYTITSAQGTPPVGGSQSTLAENVKSCEFVYQAGTSKRSALVTLQIRVEEELEFVELLRQVHISNAP